MKFKKTDVRRRKTIVWSAERLPEIGQACEHAPGEVIHFLSDAEHAEFYLMVARGQKKVVGASGHHEYAIED